MTVSPQNNACSRAVRATTYCQQGPKVGRSEIAPHGRHVLGYLIIPHRVMLPEILMGV